MVSSKFLLSLAVLLPGALSAHDTGLPRFRLRPDPENTEVGKLGFLSQGMGWNMQPATADYRAYQDPVRLTINGTNGGILYLRPTQGQPLYFVQNGDPFSDPDPTQAIYTPWNIITKTKTVNGQAVTSTWLDGSWLACSFGQRQDMFSLYSGPQGGSSRCSNIFAMEVVYDPSETTSGTPTVTGTMSGNGTLTMTLTGTAGEYTMTRDVNQTTRATTRTGEGSETETTNGSPEPTGGENSAAATMGMGGVFVTFFVAALMSIL